MPAISTKKQKPVYPHWNERCEHENGISLDQAFKKWVGEESVVETMRQRLADAPADLPKEARGCMRKHYSELVRWKKVNFAERVSKEYYFTTGIRWPYA